jgi:hypothetical protein
VLVNAARRTLIAANKTTPAAQISEKKLLALCCWCDASAAKKFCTPFYIFPPLFDTTRALQLLG